MAATVHLYEIFIHAPAERVWEALTDPDLTERYFDGTRLQSTFVPGDPFRYVFSGGGVAGDAAVDGTIETFDPPRRLVMTWHVLHDAEMADEPPSRVEWTLTPANDDGSVTRVTLRHGDLALSPRTWASVSLGWVGVIGSMKSLLERGEPLPPIRASDPLAAADVEGQWHRAQAIAANNSIWEMLDGRTHSAAEADELLSRTYAAAYHWARAERSGPINQARSSYMLSRVHATLGHGDLALHHVDRYARQLASIDDAADFDQAYLFEARARALACLGRLDEAASQYRAATDHPIADEQDRAIVEADLASGPWYGLERT